MYANRTIDNNKDGNDIININNDNEELNDMYSSHNVIRMIKSRRMRWAGQVARKGGGTYTGFWWGNLRERDHLGDPGVDERTILRWIFRKWDLGVWTGSI